MLRQRFQLLGQRGLFFLSIMGPGLITAGADNDAPGIATYSMAGSYFGFGFLWIVLWVTVGEVVAHEMAARMGAVTGKGLTDLIRERFGAGKAVLVMLGLTMANLGTTAAQFAGIAAAGELFGVTRYLAVPVGALLVWLLVVRGSYSRVEKAMLGLTLFALTYIISAFMVRPPWGEVLRSAVRPTIRFESQFLLALLATVGTTMTPWGCAYMQASVADKGVTMKEYAYTRLDVIFGAAMGNLVSAFVIICTAATLFTRGIRVETAEQAALALAPLAGVWAKQLFGLGLMGASVLAAAVLPLATTYAVCEAFGWERGLDHSADEAPMFYGLYTGLIVLSAAIVLLPGLPLFPLMWLSQVLNAVLLPAVMVFMLILANDLRIMKYHHNSRLTNLLAIMLALLVSVATVVMLVDAVR
ncbi:MAG: divalent metal cation transporter [Chloroflexi bacterium]|nr:divalent metal cation transporter [Chloroflexota bacterium]